MIAFIFTSRFVLVLHSKQNLFLVQWISKIKLLAVNFVIKAILRAESAIKTLGRSSDTSSPSMMTPLSISLKLIYSGPLGLFVLWVTNINLYLMAGVVRFAKKVFSNTLSDTYLTLVIAALMVATRAIFSSCLLLSCSLLEFSTLNISIEIWIHIHFIVWKGEPIWKFLITSFILLFLGFILFATLIISSTVFVRFESEAFLINRDAAQICSEVHKVNRINMI